MICEKSFRCRCEVTPGDDGKEQADNCGDAENMELSPSPHAAMEPKHIPPPGLINVGNVLQQANRGFIFTVLKIDYLQLNLYRLDH